MSSRRNLTDEDVSRIVDDAELGLSCNVIADRHGFADSTVQRIIREVKGLTKPTRGVRHYLLRPNAKTLHNIDTPTRSRKNDRKNKDMFLLEKDERPQVSPEIKLTATKVLTDANVAAMSANSELSALEGRLCQIDDMLNVIIEKIRRING